MRLEVGSSKTGESVPPYESRLLIQFATAEVGDTKEMLRTEFLSGAYFCVIFRVRQDMFRFGGSLSSREHAGRRDLLAVFMRLIVDINKQRACDGNGKHHKR